MLETRYKIEIVIKTLTSIKFKWEKNEKLEVSYIFLVIKGIIEIMIFNYD